MSSSSRVFSFLRQSLEVYAHYLETHPIMTKCITSGIMYAGGDLLAQKTENYTKTKLDIAKPPATTTTTAAAAEQKEDPLDAFVVNWTRTSIFFVFGCGIAGPSYHYWFNYLNELPVLLWSIKQYQQRGRILKAYTFLKSQGVDVQLDLSKIPKAAKIGKWTSKAAKILADQLIFSSLFTLVFFMSVGGMTGAVEKLEIDKHNQRYHAQRKHNNALNENSDGGLVNESGGSSGSNINKRYDVTNHISIVAYLQRRAAQRQREQNQNQEELTLKEGISWATVWNNAWSHTKQVYLETYVVDCLFWPPMQLINFTFVPVRLHFFYVNTVNLGWNTFLSLMANKPHP